MSVTPYTHPWLCLDPLGWLDEIGYWHPLRVCNRNTEMPYKEGKIKT